MEFHLILVYVEVIEGVLGSIKGLHLRHLELSRKQKMLDLLNEKGLFPLNQSFHGDYSSVLDNILHIA